MLTKKDYETIKINGQYLVKYEFCGEIKTKVMWGDELLEIENCGYEVIEAKELEKENTEQFLKED